MSEEPELPPMFTRAQARAAGYSDRQATRRLSNDTWDKVRRGVAVIPDAKFAIPPDILAARLAHVGRDLVVSHSAAARILGLPKPLAPPALIEFTDTQRPTRRRDGVRIRVAPLPDGHVGRVGDIRLTSPARTVVDCARTLHPRDALAVADAALRRNLTTKARINEVLHTQRRWPGSAQARVVLALADPRRESPLESWSAWAFDRAGVPAPVWQPDLLDQDGRFLGRPDCWWPGVAGEADGRAKYALAAAERGGADARRLTEVLTEERLREQGFRTVGADVVRWLTVDVLTGVDTVTARILMAIERAERGARFIGQIRHP